ncbi:MAG: DUF4347 domain-containing protein [Magnetococcales bacterium]|nr:DUF4347 domain-containing protein [Magnetococcales bacterium]
MALFGLSLGKTPERTPTARLRMEPLEPRCLFDGALAPGLEQIAQAREVVFIDTALQDYQQLVAGVRPGVEVELLDHGTSGLERLSQWAASHQGYDAIHIFSHGSQGRVSVGADNVTAASLANPLVKEELSVIGRALKPEGDLLLYGCDVAQGDAGKMLIDALAQATGADVAASTNPTGRVGAGGDWTLESASGTIESTSLRIDNYNNLMAVFDFTGATVGGGSKNASFTSGGRSITFQTVNSTLSITSGEAGWGDYLKFSAPTETTSVTITPESGYTFSVTSFKILNENLQTTVTYTPTGGGSTLQSVDLAIGGNATISPNDWNNLSKFVITASNDFALSIDDLTATFALASPSVSSVSIADGTRNTNTTYRTGDTINVTANFSANVNVTGTPTLALDVGGTTRTASYASGSGSSALVFSYTVVSTDTDTNGIDATANGITLGGATIRNTGDTADATLTYNLVNNTNAKVDGLVPTAGTPARADMNVSSGTSFTFDITYSDTGGSGLDTSTFATGNVTVKDPNNNALTITGSSVNGSTVTYTATPPGGSWDSGDAGTYTIGIAANQVKDLAGNAVAVNASAKTFAVSYTRLNNAPTGAVTITNFTDATRGTSKLQEGDTLIAFNTLADADGPSTLSVSYQWLRNGSVISGATGASYKLVQADVGTGMSVKASYTDSYSTAESANSPETAAVIDVNNLPTGSLEIANATSSDRGVLKAQVGDLLKSSTGSVQDGDGMRKNTSAFQYTWQADGAKVGTGTSYTLQKSDIGKKITVTLAYVDDMDTKETVTSSTITNAVVDPDARSTTLTEISTRNTSESYYSLRNSINEGIKFPNPSVTSVDLGGLKSTSSALLSDSTKNNSNFKSNDFNAIIPIPGFYRQDMSDNTTDQSNATLGLNSKINSSLSSSQNNANLKQSIDFTKLQFSGFGGLGTPKAAAEDSSQKQTVKAQEITRTFSFEESADGSVKMLPPSIFSTKDFDTAQRLKYSSDNLPAWLKIDKDTGELTGTPPKELKGSIVNVKIIATDPETGEKAEVTIPVKLNNDIKVKTNTAK